MISLGVTLLSRTAISRTMNLMVQVGATVTRAQIWARWQTVSAKTPGLTRREIAISVAAKGSKCEVVRVWKPSNFAILHRLARGVTPRISGVLSKPMKTKVKDGFTAIMEPN